MPCLNFLGEKSWSAAWRDGGSTWSSSFWNSSRSAAGSLSLSCRLESAGPAITKVRRERRTDAERTLRRVIMMVGWYHVGVGVRLGVVSQIQCCFKLL